VTRRNRRDERRNVPPAGVGARREARRHRLASRGVRVHLHPAGLFLSAWAEPVGCPAPGLKITYATRENAEAAADAIASIGMGDSYPYPCDFPGYGPHWHLTSRQPYHLGAPT
jgi:hypothetical protein